MRSYDDNSGCLVSYIFLYIIGGICWFVNLYKLLMCDFEAPFREEIIYAIGVFIPPASLITVWL